MKVSQNALEVSTKLSEIANKNFQCPKIGEFESDEEFQIRVEKERRKYESVKLDAKLRLEEQNRQLQRDVNNSLEECIERAFAFTNRLREASLVMSAQELPYFDRDSQSFKDIRSPFSSRIYEKRPRRRGGRQCQIGNIKFDVNAKSEPEYVSLRFKNIAEAGKFKGGISSGEIKAWFYCAFRVGLPREWIEQRKGYERVKKEMFAGYGALKTIARAVVQAKVYGNWDGYVFDDDAEYEDKEVCRDCVMGKIVPVDIVSRKIIIEGEVAKSMDIEIVSTLGTWMIEKRAEGDAAEKVGSARRDDGRECCQHSQQEVQTSLQGTGNIGNGQMVTRQQPTVNIDVLIGDVKLKEGEVLFSVNGKQKSYKIPIRWIVKEGVTYGGNEMSLVRNGRHYKGKLDRFSVDWQDSKTLSVTMKEYLPYAKNSLTEVKGTGKVGNGQKGARQPPTVNIDVYVGGAKLNEGEVHFMVNGKPKQYKVPIRWSVKEGATYGGNEITLVQNGRHYKGKLERFKVDWQGSKRFSVLMEEYVQDEVEKLLDDLENGTR